MPFDPFPYVSLQDLTPTQKASYTPEMLLEKQKRDMGINSFPAPPIARIPDSVFSGAEAVAGKIANPLGGINWQAQPFSQPQPRQIIPGQIDTVPSHRLPQPQTVSSRGGSVPAGNPAPPVQPKPSPQMDMKLPTFSGGAQAPDYKVNAPSPIAASIDAPPQSIALPYGLVMAAAEMLKGVGKKTVKKGEKETIGDLLGKAVGSGAAGYMQGTQLQMAQAKQQTEAQKSAADIRQSDSSVKKNQWEMTDKIPQETAADIAKKKVPQALTPGQEYAHQATGDYYKANTLAVGKNAETKAGKLSLDEEVKLTDMYAKQYPDPMIPGAMSAEGRAALARDKAARGIDAAPGAKVLDQATALRFKQMAGGDLNKARELARQEGYSF